MPARTSATHPLQICPVQVGARGGVLGITLCPGKHGDSYFGDAWARDLDADLDVIAGWGASAVVTLIEAHEFTLLGVPELGAGVRQRGMAWHHLPIVDVHVPDQRFERGWAQAGPALRESLLAGARVLVHCRGGLGRAGTVAARVLVETGATPHEAIQRVRAARPGAIETTAQAQYVLALPQPDRSG